jgi:hypothetical protein
MSRTLTQNQVNTLERVADIYSWKVIDYAGRAMYGNTCLGVVLPEANIFKFAAIVHEQDAELAMFLASSIAKIDSMGRDNIVLYFEYVSVAGTSLEETDDDY